MYEMARNVVNGLILGQVPEICGKSIKYVINGFHVSEMAEIRRK